MSRTDVHRPWCVQVADPYERHRMRRWYYWADQVEHGWLPLYTACGCAMCTMRYWRRLQNRQVRVLWRRARQNLLKTLPEDYPDMDVPPLRGSWWW